MASEGWSFLCGNRCLVDVDIDCVRSGEEVCNIEGGCGGVRTLRSGRGSGMLTPLIIPMVTSKETQLPNLR